LHNFDHTLISKISNTHVNSFAYISQIIHNSIIFVINKKKKEQININKQVSNEILNNNLSIADHRKALNKSTYEDNIEETAQTEYFIEDDENLIEKITDIIKNMKEDERPLIHYPANGVITMEQYYKLQPLLKTVSIIRDQNA
jgi:hypothetical protein